MHNLNLQDCCIDKMAKYLDARQGQKVWYPSLAATWTGKSDTIQYGILVEYLNKKDWHGIATVIHSESNTSNDSCAFDPNASMLCYVIIVSTDAHPKLIYCFGADSWDETTQTHCQPNQGKDFVRCALHHARKLKKEISCSSTENTSLSLFTLRCMC